MPGEGGGGCPKEKTIPFQQKEKTTKSVQGRSEQRNGGTTKLRTVRGAREKAVKKSQGGDELFVERENQTEGGERPGVTPGDEETLR